MASSENRAPAKEKGGVYVWRGYPQETVDKVLPGVCGQGVAVSHSYCLAVSERGQVYEGPVTGHLQLCRPLSGHQVVQVSCNVHHMAAVTVEGRVFCWGDSTSGQCGMMGRLFQPQQVNIIPAPESTSASDGVANTPVRVIQVGCGSQHTMALSVKGELWTWGSGEAMGLGITNTVLRPCLVDYLVGRRVISVACGAHHTLALLAKTQQFGAQKSSYRIERHSQTPATCARCKGDIYTYTENGEECVISDQHVCPLGLELYPQSIELHHLKATGGSLNNLVLRDVSQMDGPAAVHNSPTVGGGREEAERVEKQCGVHRAMHPSHKAVPPYDKRGTSREEAELGSCQDNQTWTEGRTRTDTQAAKDDLSQTGDRNHTDTQTRTDDQSRADDRTDVTSTLVPANDAEVDGQCSTIAQQSQVQMTDEVLLRQNSKIEPLVSSVRMQPSSEAEPVQEIKTSVQVMDSQAASTERMCRSSEAVNCTDAAQNKANPELDSFGATNVSEPTEHTVQSQDIDSNAALGSEPGKNCDSGSTGDSESIPVDSSLSQITKSRSSFLDEMEAKEYLEKQLYGDGDDVFLSSLGSMSAGSDASGNAGPFVKKLQQNLLSYMPTSNVHEAVSSWTKNVVSNIRTSIDRFSFTSTEGVVDADDRETDDVDEDGDPSDLQYLTDGTSSLPRSASWCVESKSTLKAVATRKSSLPVFVTHVRDTGGVLEVTSITDTEVWSFGQGSKGQLGHGDRLDRLHPTCVKELTDKHVVQLMTSSYHCLALTINSQVHSWGCNDDNQLGYKDMATASLSPRLVKIAGDPAVWDIAAGDRHSIFLTDGANLSTDVFYVGASTSLSDNDEYESVGKMSRPTPISALDKVGLIVRLAAGGATCACIAESCSQEFASTLHELAVIERRFHCQMTRISSVILKPFLSPELVQRLEKTSHGTPFELLVDSFDQIAKAVAVNHLEATEVLRSGLDLGRLSCISQPDTLVAMYQNYSKCFCDVLALGGFQYCVNAARKFFEGISGKFAQFLEFDEIVTGDIPTTLQKVLQGPLDRIKQFTTLIEKFAHLFPAFSPEQHQLTETTEKWHSLILTTAADQKLASTTKAFWDSCQAKLTDSLRESGRRLVRESKSSPISLHSGGRFSSHHFILFNDIFVHAQYSSHQIYPLATVWVESPHKSDSLKNVIVLTTPEDVLTLVTPTASDKAEWLWTLIQTVDTALADRKSLGAKSKGVGRGFMSPPRDRNSYHVFTRHPVYKDAKYEGLWREGKVHGQGQMQWPDGSKYIGHFQNGLQEGHGLFTVEKPEGHEVWEGHWKAGKLHGLGCIQYASGDVYEGSFKEGKRHGHGYLKQGRLTTGLASIYIGEWVNDKKCGFGVLSDILKGQRYIGLWQDDCRHGNGIIVTLDGMYFEGQFVQNKMTGFGLLMTEDNSSYEGEFAGSPHLYGKGVLTLPSGDHIQGHFNGSFSEGIKITGVFYKGTEPVTERKGFTHALGLIPKSYGCLSVPADRKWNDLFYQCYCMLGCEQEGPTNTSRAWEKVAAVVALGRKAAKKCGRRLVNELALRQILGPFKVPPAYQNFRISLLDVVSKEPWPILCDSQSVISCRQAAVSHDVPGIADDLARIPTFNGGVFSIEQVAKIRQYLTKAFDSAFHPLGALLEGLVNVYRATYIGVGAHPRLLHHAVEEVRSYIDRIYPVVIILFPVLPPAESEAVEICSELVADPSSTERVDETTEVFSPAGLLHPLLLPKLYPPLFDLYALYNEKEDEVYWKRVLHWNRQPDIALMSYLGLAQDFWLVEESAYNNPRQRLSNVKERSYTGAIDMLQRLSTSFCPAEKLHQIHQTFHEVNKAVQAQLKWDHRWCMDDLFPVFMYIVVRARIQHLGAEIHFIDDLMESHLQHGELGLMFTTLKACYFQIQHEKVT